MNRYFLFVAVPLSLFVFAVAITLPQGIRSTLTTRSGALEQTVAAVSAFTPPAQVASVIRDLTNPPAGFTTLLPSAETRFIFVSSSSGNNDNSGTLPDSPVKTLAYALSIVRDGKPDWVLLKKGDVWKESFGELNKSGPSADQPIVIASYGFSGTRPQVEIQGKVPNSDTDPKKPNAAIEFDNARNVAFVDIELASNRVGGINTGAGIMLGHVKGFQNLLIEGVKIEGFQYNISSAVPDKLGIIGAYGKNLKIRRSVIVGAYHPSGGKAQGVYLAGIDGILIEDTVFSHNGWLEGGELPSRLNPPGSVKANAGGPNHNAYLQYDNSVHTTVKNTMFLDGAWNGMQVRNGGKITDNLFVQNNHGLLVGIGDKNIQNEIVRNVILATEPHTLDSANNKPKPGTGLEIVPMAKGLIKDNIIANSANASLTYGLRVSREVAYKGSVPQFNVDLVKRYVPSMNVLLENNIVYKNGVSFYNDAGNLAGDIPKSAKVSNNDFQSYADNNCFFQSGSKNLSGDSYTSNTFNCNGASEQYVIRPTSSQPRQNMNFATWQITFDPGRTNTERVTTYGNPNRSVAEYNGAIGGGANYAAFVNEAVKQSKANWRSSYTAMAVNKYIAYGFGKNFPGPATSVPPPTPVPPPVPPTPTPTPTPAPPPVPAPTPVSTLRLTAPAAQTILRQGQTYDIIWTGGVTNTTITTGSIVLENSTTGAVVATIASGVPMAQKKYVWTVPTTIAASSAYNLEFRVSQALFVEGPQFAIALAQTPPVPPTPVPPPVPPTPPQWSGSVSAMRLLNAVTDVEIAGHAALANNAVINLTQLGVEKINIDATVTGSVGSIVFTINAPNGAVTTATQSVVPFAVFGDSNGNFDEFTPQTGVYMITATPYEKANGTGIKGAALTRTVTIARTVTPPTPTPVPPPVPPTPVPQASAAVSSFTIINAGTNQPIAGYENITANRTINFAQLPTRNINVKANTTAAVKSVVFAVSPLDSSTQNHNGRLEYTAPFALAGDSGGDYAAWYPQLKTYTITGTPYTTLDGTGTKGSALTVSLTFTNVVTNQSSTVIHAIWDLIKLIAPI